MLLLHHGGLCTIAKAVSFQSAILTAQYTLCDAISCHQDNNHNATVTLAAQKTTSWYYCYLSHQDVSWMLLLQDGRLCVTN